MKKFISLFVIAAVLAFAGTAFAANDDVRAAATVTTSTAATLDQNNGAVDTNSTNAYYFGDMTGEAFDKIGAHFKTAKEPATGITVNDKLGGFISTTYVNSGITPTVDTNIDKDGAFENVNYEATMKITGINLYERDSGNPASAKAGVDLTIVPTAVTFADSKVAPIELGAKPADFDLEIATDGITLNEFKTAPKAELSLGGTPNSDITVTVSKAGAVAFTNNAKTAGQYTVTLKTTGTSEGLSVNEGAVEGITVANFPNTADQDIFTFTFTVLPAATNSADIAGASKIEIVSGDAEGDIVISTDIISADAEAAKTIVGSTDVLIYGNLPSNFAETSRDVAAVTRGGKDYYDVTLKKDDLNTLAPGSYTIYIGNIKQADQVRTDSVTITVIAPTPVPPTPSDDVVVDGPADPNNDLLKATTNTAYVAEAIALAQGKGLSVLDGKLTSQTVVNAISNAKAHVWGTNSQANVTSLPIVSADIQGNGTIATIMFVDILGSELVSDDTRGRVVNANDLNVMKIVASNDVTRLARAGDVKGKTAEQLNGTFNVYRSGSLVDSVNSKSGDYELRVYIVDNGKYDLNDKVNGNVVDPLALVKSTGGSGSSSSGCDLGFGLVAAAGLAALALRKRSK